MSDARVWCKKCEETTDHMHLDGRVCICAVCGERNQTKNLDAVKQNIQQRREKSLTAVARMNFGVLSNPVKSKEAIMPKAMFTQEEIEDIKREKADGCTDKDISNRRGCAVSSVWRLCHSKPKRFAPSVKEGSGKPVKPHTTRQVEAGGAFRVALARMVDKRVEEALAGLDGRIEAVLTRLLK